MKKKLIYILFSLISILIVIPSFAFSYFYFFDNSNSSGDSSLNDNHYDIDSNETGIDDIKENFTGIKEEGKEYTIYFFPSSLYTQYYYNQLHSENNNYLVPYQNNINPEDLFGYIDGNNKRYIFRDEVDEERQTALDSSINGKDKGDLGYVNYIHSTFDTLRDADKVNVGNNADILVASYVQYSGDDYKDGQASNGMDDYHYTWDYASRDFGDPADRVLPIYYYHDFKYKYTYNNWSGRVVEVEVNNPPFQVSNAQLSKDNGQFNYDNIYRYDRFGFWPNNRVNFINPDSSNNFSYYLNGNNIVSKVEDSSSSYDLGRYLPIKITVTDTMSLSLYESLIDFPEADMGDRNKDNGNPNAWYNYVFSGWGYFDSNNVFSLTSSSTTNVNYLEDSFTSFDVKNTFDIMSNLDHYDQDDDGIIRLFPIFSNGKDYQNLSGSTEIKDGLRDSYKLAFDSFEPNRDLDNNCVNFGNLGGPFEYEDKCDDRIDQFEKGTLYGFNDINVDFDVDNYFLYDKNESNINIQVARLLNFNYNSHFADSNQPMCLQGAFIKEGSYGWTSWEPHYGTLNLKNSRIVRLDENNQWVSDETYGFSRGEGLYNIYVFSYNTVEFGGSFGLINFVNNDLELLYPGKNINIVSLTDQNSPLYTYENTSFIVGIEKVLEVKFADGLNSDSSLNDQVETKYVDAPSMLRDSNPVYLKEDVLDSKNFVFGQGLVENHQTINDFIMDDSNFNIDNSETPLNENIFFVIKNIDFTNYSSINEAAFQIKLFLNDDTSSQFIFNDPYENSSDENPSLKENESFDALIYNPSDKNNVTSEEIFIPASYYFEIAENDGFGYVPRHTTYFGMYDFILYFNGSNYELYCYRHFNVRVSLFSENPGHVSDINDPYYGYAEYNQDNLIWERQTFVGSYANLSDNGIYYKSSDNLNPTLSFKDAITDYLKDKSDGTYFIKDHVTGITIIKIIKNGDEITPTLEVDSFRIRKNFYLYLEKVN